jgi:chromosome partitioning protein
MSKIISIINQKGGVGKTTTSINLSAALSQLGHKILLVDLDPQGNASSGLGIDKNSLQTSLYDIFAGSLSLSSIIQQTEIDSLSIAPSNSDLVGAELLLFNKDRREKILEDKLEEVKSQFDFIFIDCPPSLGLLTVNAIVSSDSILIPLQCEYYALEGISSLLETIELSRKELNPRLEIEGVLLTMFDSRTNLSREVGADAAKAFDKKLYRTVIPRNIKLAECPGFGQHIFTYAIDSAGAYAYSALAEEFLENNQSNKKLQTKTAA